MLLLAQALMLDLACWLDRLTYPARGRDSSLSVRPFTASRLPVSCLSGRFSSPRLVAHYYGLC
jgi:hypothetical protein